MKRYIDWDVRLVSAFNRRKGERVYFGYNDCGSLTRDLINLMSPEDVISFQYGTRDEAVDLYSSGFIEGLVEGGVLEDVWPSEAYTGDIVVVGGEELPSIHVLLGDGVATSVDSDVVSTVPYRGLPGTYHRCYRFVYEIDEGRRWA